MLDFLGVGCADVIVTLLLLPLLARFLWQHALRADAVRVDRALLDLHVLQPFGVVVARMLPRAVRR